MRYFLYKIFPSQFKRIYTDIRYNRFVKDNFIISSYPKSGSTYLRFLIFCYLTDSSPNYDLMEKFVPYVGPNDSKNSNFRKTHELTSRYYTKGIYIRRDPREIAWSSYRSLKRRKIYTKNFSNFLELFLNDQISTYGDWHHHSLESSNFIKENRNSWIVVEYNTLMKSPELVLSRVLQHADIDVSDVKLRSAVVNASVENVRNAEKKANQFSSLISKGYHPIVGDGNKLDWRSEMPSEYESKFKKLDILHNRSFWVAPDDA